MSDQIAERTIKSCTSLRYKMPLDGEATKQWAFILPKTIVSPLVQSTSPVH